MWLPHIDYCYCTWSVSSDLFSVILLTGTRPSHFTQSSTNEHGGQSYTRIWEITILTTTKPMPSRYAQMTTAYNERFSLVTLHYAVIHFTWLTHKLKFLRSDYEWTFGHSLNIIYSPLLNAVYLHVLPYLQIFKIIA